MKKIVIDYLYNNYFSARSKAREDVNIIAQKNGYEYFPLKTKTTTEAFTNKPTSIIRKYFYHFKKLIVLLKAIYIIPNNSKILIQYPLSPFGDVFSWLFFKTLKLKSCEITILVHDIVCYREKGYFRKMEIRGLNSVDKLILHTSNMETLFRNNGITKPKINLLYLFDYIINNGERIRTNGNKAEIAFAGALYKSSFLQELHKVKTSALKFNLYGIFSKDIQLNENIDYKGKFEPNDVFSIQADWGLVWDGDSLDECHGILGDYLKINSPHKTSLYIAAKIPIIIWKQSALATYIQENHLGIVINSIKDIEPTLLSLNKQEKSKILESVAIYSKKLTNGEMLSSQLS